MSGLLVLAGTPIGNPSDASPRLAAEIAAADLVAAEDTRRLHRLAGTLGVALSGRLVSYHEHNEASRTPQLIAAMLAGSRVLLVSDAGMPSVSDPGYRLVRAAVGAAVPVTAVPGPSAVLTALALSALPVDRFVFEGFLPRRPGDRTRRLTEVAADPRTLVFFEAPHRLAATLASMSTAFGPGRSAAVCRELTKTYEQVLRGPLGELAAWAADGVRGEITIVVAGAQPGDHDDSAALVPAELARRVAALTPTMGRKAAISEVARTAGLPKRVVFDAVVAGRGAPSNSDLSI